MKHSNQINLIRLAFLIFMLFCLTLNSDSLFAQSQPDRTKWFRDAKFGMFIHFGATETKDEGLSRGERHDAAVHQFNPVDFDADQWVQVAKEGGAKYIVFTTKHHDGFCKWDSALTDWDVIDQTKFKRDIVKELDDACQKANMRLGFYYSIADWHHPEYEAAFSNRNGFHYSPNPDAEITKYMKYMYGQIEELCEKYHPSLFWFDGSAGFRPPERKRLLGQQDMVDLIHSHGAICNSRLGDDDGLRYVDYLNMGDNQSPPGSIGVPFETCGTMNDSWHYKANDTEYKSAGELIKRVVSIVGKGGNYLLNVGPDEKGVIPKESVDRFKAIGAWLEKNGEAIYATEAGPYPHAVSWGSMTQRKVGANTRLYLNVIDWPQDGSFHLDGLDNKIIDASLLVGGETLEHESTFDAAAGIKRHTITVPTTAPDPNVSVIALTLEGDASMEQAYLQQSDGSVLLDAYGATIHDKDFVPNKPSRPVDFKQFTVPQSNKGITPARMLCAGGFGQVGQALSWDFRMVQPGTYEVAVIRLAGKNSGDGRLRATVAGQSVENTLQERERMSSRELPTHLKESLSVIGKVKIDVSGMQTLTLEVAQDFSKSAGNIRGVRLLPVAADN